MLVLGGAAAFAQSDAGTIEGFVHDQTGALVPGAKVVIRGEANGDLHPVTTDGQGHYTVPNLLPGFYAITAEAAGFKRFESTHNKLDANTSLALDANLAIGAASETVEVTDTASVLQTESSAVTQNINGEQIQNQELNGRNPLYMASLLPGVRSSSTLGDFNFSLSNGGYNINGARQQDSLITMDGAPATRTRGSGTSIGVADVDSTQEIQLLTADYAAEYGRASGGEIRIVTKGGQRDFHGALFEYFRNSDLNANTWQRNLSTTTNFASPFRYNDFGFDIGGPVAIPGKFERWRNRAFFFVAGEWTRYRFTDTQTQAVPTTLMREGNFSELLSPNPWYSGSTQIYDPLTCAKKGSSSCVPFAGNIIPASRLSPNGIGILSAYPAPTPGFLQGTQNWIAQAAHPINQRKGNTNGDFLVNQNNRIEFRRTDFGYYEYQPFDQGSGLTGKYFIRPNQANTLAWTSTISPTMINEARATVSLDDVYIPVNTSLAGFDRSQFGIDYPYLFPEGKDLQGKIPSVSVPTFYGLAGGPYPSHSSGPIYTFSDSLTKVWGNHTFKAGFSYEYSGENDRDQINVSTVPGGANNQNGSFVFSDGGLGATSGVGLANLALGVADSYTEIGPRAYTVWRGAMYEEFVQDSWKITPKLHIDYGLRFSQIEPFAPRWGNADYFDPASYNPANAVQIDPKTGNVINGTGNPYNGVVIPGFSNFTSDALGRGVLAAGSNAYSGLFAPNLKKGYVNLDEIIQPRLGFAYQIDGKTVIRSGLGRFATRMGLLDNVFPGGNSPFQPFVTVNNVSVDNPGASLGSNESAALTITTLDKNLKAPESWSWNLTLERELPWNSVLTVAYVGRRGLHQWRVFDINQAPVDALLANPGVKLNALRPYLGFAEIQQEQSNGTSMYNSFQLTWAHRFAHGLTASLAYTYAESRDDSTNYRDIVPDTYNASNLWGPSEFDTRHAFVATYSYDLPFFRNQSLMTGKLLGGWQITGNAQWQTGTPCGVGTNNDFAGVGETGSFGCGSQGQFWVLHGSPDIVGGFAGPTGNANSPKYFSTVSPTGGPLYTPPAAGTFNLQNGIRDLIYQPAFVNYNLGLFKKFAITEKTGFEFRAEAYNFVNHPNWGGVNFNPTSSQFGEVNSKSSSNPRTLQLSLRFGF